MNLPISRWIGCAGPPGGSLRAVCVAFMSLVLGGGLLSGCSKRDKRLEGTWRSNADATVKAAFQRTPNWTNASPEKVARFRDLFGHMTATYGRGKLKTDFNGKQDTIPYRVLEKGSNFVVIRSGGALDGDRAIRIEFVDGNNAFWIDTGPLANGLLERFDRVKK
jgi:hypothetical protein